jgi:hypothetical protein
MVDDEFALIKDSITIKISDNPSRILKCDSTASGVAREATRNFNSGKGSILIGTILELFLTPLGGIPFLLSGSAKTHTGMAGLIDAMNIHNDQSDCFLPSDQNEKKKFEMNPEHEELIIPASVEILYNSTATILNNQVRIRCGKKGASPLFSTITLSFEGVIGVDKYPDGSFKWTSVEVEKGDKFYIRTKSLLLHVEVVRKTDSGVTLTFQEY